MSELIDRQALRAAHGLGSDCHDCKRDMKSCQYDRDYSLMDFCEWLDDAPTASPWHRVEEELPNDGEWAIFTNGKVVSVERFKEDAYNHFFPASQWFDFEDAIAWMPLPEPPKEDA